MVPLLYLLVYDFQKTLFLWRSVKVIKFLKTLGFFIFSSGFLNSFGDSPYRLSSAKDDFAEPGAPNQYHQPWRSKRWERMKLRRKMGAKKYNKMKMRNADEGVDTSARVTRTLRKARRKSGALAFGFPSLPLPKRKGHGFVARSQYSKRIVVDNDQLSGSAYDARENDVFEDGKVSKREVSQRGSLAKAKKIGSKWFGRQKSAKRKTVATDDELPRVESENLSKRAI